MTGNEVRRKFLDYFKMHNHQVVRSSSLVPLDDPTLLFSNAGMVQFKRTFLGEEKKSYNKAATSQKCVRAGGKHNDLENVGYTARHHTFFEMLGNFSFGDYFKEKAIGLAWDLLINVYGLSQDKLWVSVYLNDDEAYELWHNKTGISEDRIVRLGKKDNFWSMGDTGPCGPCSEILIDRGEKSGCGSPDCKVGCECDRYLEIWNLVFMQFDRDSSGQMTPLPKPSIDTGMGLERIVSVIQDVPTNYDTDLILPIIKKVETLSEMRIGKARDVDVAMKVIADHSRAAAFLIGDGVLPSNEGRGYVLRRIMRRAIRYGRNIGLLKPFLHETSRVVVDIMKSIYPELSTAEAFIMNVIKNEENRFSETLDNGLKLLNDTIAGMRIKGKNMVPGSVIFKLYDTYGFPVDIIKDVVRDEKMILDIKGFNESMQIQRNKSKSVKTFSMASDAYKNICQEGIKPEFVGYDKTGCSSRVLAVIKGGSKIKEASANMSGDQVIEIITEATPFYAESGGQAGDTGKITGPNFDIKITNTIKDPTGLIIHEGKIISGCIKQGEEVNLQVDKKKRDDIARNHTATHILNAALQNIIGDHVKQAGSLVTHGRLRFDFTHFSQVDPNALDKIETYVNDRIRENIPVQFEEMDAEEAFRSGATALFEEKYGERVRVISLDDFSKELCGGTHTKNSGDIGLFKIIGESSVASGIRRVDALTGGQAVLYIQQLSKIVRDTANLIKEAPEAVVKRIEKILSNSKYLEKEIEQLKLKIASMSADEVEGDIKSIGGINVLAKKISAETPAVLRNLADRFKDKIKSGIIVLGCDTGSKAFLIVMVTKDLVGRFNAGSIIKQVSPLIGGGGGGRPDMAQAGGTMPENLDQAFKKAYEVIKGR